MLSPCARGLPGVDPPLRRCFGKAGTLKDGPSESAPDDSPLETGDGLRTVKDKAGVEVMFTKRKRCDDWGSAKDSNSAGVFREAFRLVRRYSEAERVRDPVHHLKLAQKCHRLFRPRVPSPERLVFLGRVPQVRLRVDITNGTDSTVRCRCVGVARLPPCRHNCETVDEQQG